MTVRADDGPQVTVGIESPMGVANQPVGVAGVGQRYVLVQQLLKRDLESWNISRESSNIQYI